MADVSTELALRRTEWALERTQLAWVRMAFTFLSAAYAADKGTAALAKAQVLEVSDWVSGTHWGGFCLAAMATLVLIMSTLNYLKRARELATQSEQPTAVSLSALPASLVVIGLGITMCVMILVWG